MPLRKLTVREFRASFSKLDEPVNVGLGIYFPTMGLLEEYIRLREPWLPGPGDTSPKAPPPGESVHKAPPASEATSPATPEGPSEGHADREKSSESAVRSQPHASGDPTVAARQLAQLNRDHILRQLQRGRKRGT